MENLVLQTIGDKLLYCRSASNESIQLSTILENNHANKHCKPKALVCTSGMSAIRLTLHGLLLKFKDDSINLFYGSELYCDTYRTIDYLSKIHTFTAIEFNVNEKENLTELIKENKDKNNIIFIESATNPSGDIFDYSIISNLRKICKKLTIIVDNTWLTHVIFNPFEYDIDIVILSLTKYYSAGNCIGGAILTKTSALFKKIQRLSIIEGNHVSPLNCNIISVNVLTIEKRVFNTSESVKEVAKYMSGNKLFDIRHCSIETDPSYILAQKYYKNDLCPGVISFIVNLSKEDAIKWMKSRDITYATSYGGKDTRFCNYPQTIDDTHTKCRLAIGYDDTSERIIQELSKL
jgi:cystathionine beta-lyase/cystathionine gamma-synthase